MAAAKSGKKAAKDAAGLPGSAPPGQERPAQPAVADNGLSLDQLSAAFAEMLQTGEDPYAPAPELPGAPADESLGDLDRAATAAADDSEITPLSIFEALLFVGSPTGECLTSAQVAGIMRGVRPAEIDVFVRELNERYEARGAAYFISAEGAGYRLALKTDLNRVRDRFYGRTRRARLSQAAIEVLSLVAYHEPITAEEINRMRDTSSESVLSQLVRRQLLRLERRAEDRRATYYTTPRFLALFGLESLGDLPKSADMPV